MAGSTVSANMNLVIPTVGVEPGPQWASDINASLTIIDAHNHSAGSGVPITPSGMNISSDLTMNSNNLISARSLKMTAQVSPLALAADVGCLYVSGVDLYYNDENGNQVRITQSGGVSGTPGSIAGLVSPASATYVPGTQTFVWQSAASTPANMDAASYIFRNLVASSKGLTLSPPAAMAADYALVLPNLPVSTKIMVLDSSGNMSASYTTDNSTIEVNGSSQIAVKALGIGTAQLASLSVTDAKIDNLTITGEKIAAATITTDKLAPGFDSEIYLDTGNGFGSTNNKIRRFTTVVHTVGSDLTLTQSSTLGDSITAVTGGLYSVCVSDRKSTGGVDYGFSVNTSSGTTAIASLSYANGRRLICSPTSASSEGNSRTLRLQAGDVIRHQGDGTANDSGFNSYLIVTKVGP